MWITQTISQTVNLCTPTHTHRHTLAVTHTWAEFFSTALRSFLWLAMGASSLALSSLPPLLPRKAATLTPCLPLQLCLLVFVCVCVRAVFYFTFSLYILNCNHIILHHISYSSWRRGRHTSDNPTSFSSSSSSPLCCASGTFLTRFVHDAAAVFVFLVPAFYGSGNGNTSPKTNTNTATHTAAIYKHGRQEITLSSADWAQIWQLD